MFCSYLFVFFAGPVTLLSLYLRLTSWTCLSDNKRCTIFFIRNVVSKVCRSCYVGLLNKWPLIAAMIDLVYSRRQLLGLRSAPGSKSTLFIHELATLGLLRYRGTRAGALTRRRRARAFVYKHGFSVVQACQPRVQEPRTRTLIDVKRVSTLRSLTIGVLNVRSLGNKAAAVLDTITDNSLDLFAVVESWHDSAESPSVIASTPPSHHVYERARPRRQSKACSLKTNHGGICVFVHKDIQVRTVDLPTFKSFELLPLFVRIGVLSFVFVAIYRPEPASAVNDDFFIDFADVLERTSSFAGCVIVGDLNIHLDDTCSPNTARFVSLLDSFGLVEHVRLPTRGVHQLDVFISRSDGPDPVVRVDPPLMSDHSLIVASFDVNGQHTAPLPTVTRRRWRSFNFDNFIADLQQTQLIVDPPCDVNELFDLYDKTLAELLDKHAPWQRTKLRARPAAPWYDAECRVMKAKTRKLEKVYRQQRSVQSEHAWRTQFSLQRALYQEKFVNYWSCAIDECHGDSKALWSKLRPLLQPKPASVSTLTAEDLAQYFTTKISKIRASTSTSPPPHIDDRFVPEMLVDLQPATADEVTTVLKRSAAKHCQLDSAPTWLVKRAADVLAPVIAHMCNTSFAQSRMPDSSKRAIVRPSLKKPALDPNDPASYRPISNLSFVSKVVEKVVDARFADHVARHNLLPVLQSAYRPYHSTETAVVCILNDMIGAIDQGHIGALMLLDLSAAFDTVDHQILTDVLRRRFGIAGTALDWMVDYLSNRSQVVRVGSCESGVITLQFGVPQGSVLGPKLFLEYAEDVCPLLARLKYHLFADDMQGLKHGLPADGPQIVSTLTDCATDVIAWCAAKRLQLNADKTEVMWFGTAAKLSKIPLVDSSIRVGSTDIQPVSVVRDLGVMIDAELTMRDHVSRTARTCFYHLRRLRSIRRQLGRDVTARLVSALILSRLDYCNAVLAGLPASTLAPFQRVLHAAARLILDLRPRDHVSAALRELHWLPIAQRIDYKLCLLVFKSSLGRAPVYITSMLKPAADVPSLATLRAATSGNYIVPRTNRRIGDRAFSVAAPKAWNSLPTELKTASLSIDTFKRRLKTHLFNVAYSQ